MISIQTKQKKMAKKAAKRQEKIRQEKIREAKLKMLQKQNEHAGTPHIHSAACSHEHSHGEHCGA